MISSSLNRAGPARSAAGAGRDAATRSPARHGRGIPGAGRDPLLGGRVKKRTEELWL